MAEREGFEPPDSCPSTVFKTAAFDRSAISPKDIKFYRRAGGSGAFVEPKRSALTALPSLQKKLSFLRRAGGCGAFVVPKRSALTALPSLQSDYS